jgi:protein-disulfide isomerase
MYRIPIVVAITCMAIILSILTSSSSLLSLSSFDPYNRPFAYAKENPFLNDNSNNKNNISLSNLIKQGSPHLGNSSAPIAIIDFSDFQCHLCARYVKTTEPQINMTYIQTGKVNLVFKHLPNRGIDSTAPSLAAQCTNDQGKFWDFHKMLYENQGPIDSGWVSRDNLKKFASKIPGLNIQQFNSCFENEKYKTFVAKDLALAASFGFTDTPSFIIINSDGSDPEILKGAQPFASFKALIDKKIEQRMHLQ